MSRDDILGTPIDGYVAVTWLHNGIEETTRFDRPLVDGMFVIGLPVDESGEPIPGTHVHLIPRTSVVTMEFAGCGRGICVLHGGHEGPCEL